MFILITTITALKVNAHLVINFQQFNLVSWSQQVGLKLNCISIHARDDLGLKVFHFIIKHCFYSQQS